MKLTIKQEKFCNLYIELGNASEAYRQAGYSQDVSEKSLNELASRLLKNVKIMSRLNELRSDHAERHNINVDDLIRELEEARQVALGAMTPQASAAVGATMGKAKLLGLIVDKSENKHDVKVDEVKDLTDDELKSELEKLGINH
jgi:phage terminase small subunit